MSGNVADGSNIPSGSGVNTPLGGSGTGYTPYRSAGSQYGTAQTIAFIKDLGRTWASTHPNDPVIQVGEISKQGGGPLPPHKSHQQGIDFDLRYMRNDGRVGLTTTTSATYSQPLTQDLVNILRGTGQVQFLFSNDSGLTGINFEANHYRDLHVRLRP